MDRRWLEAQLEAGRSIEAIAREVAKDARTVGYWVHKHGLRSAHAQRHASRGGIEREALAALVGEGLTQQALAERLGVGASTIRHWLRKHGLETARARQVVEMTEGQTVVLRRCQRHGETEFVVTGSAARLRCKRCRTEHVTRRRRKLKEILVAEGGGACRLCGYQRSPAALQFHHLDPSTKAFSLSSEGVARSLAAARREAAKCMLLCANCHAEVESGIASIPP